MNGRGLQKLPKEVHVCQTTAAPSKIIQFHDPLLQIFYEFVLTHGEGKAFQAGHGEDNCHQSVVVPTHALELVSKVNM